MKLDIGVENRQEILQYSLLIENFTSIFLSKLLGIENYEETKSFGNQSGNLSFNQKIDLLIDIGALDKNEKKKFQTFMEIRNQFMHNYNAKNYESCFNYLEGKATFILKIFPQNAELPTEEKLHKATIELAGDVLKTTVNLIEKIKEKISKDVEGEMLKKFKTDTLEIIKQIEDGFNELYTAQKEKGAKTINIEELKGLGTLIRRSYYSLLTKKITEKNKLH
ncbi:hypothetical protein ACHRV1_25695 [Flavobacterium aquidurense]|uniref:Mannitol repressor n=1 Tax=Flavobacterium piscisymbiosum TaxID=2893753 RepID=A0ABS8MHT2_9FLAO|nr:hypothetical protein [Flavobacterium sp. F-30]MCC9065042.1 hypothetical protein [Flavobacterium sp. F-30]